MTEILRSGVNRRMRQAVRHKGTIYLTGQVGNPGDDVSAQTRTTLEQIDTLLAEFGANKSRLLHCTIWLADMADFDAMNRVWESWIDPASPPARATCQAPLADAGYRVEVVAIAAAQEGA